MAFLKQPSQCSGSLSAGSHTPLTPLVYCLARIGVFMFQLIQALYPVPVSLQHRHVPRTPLPAKGVTSLQRDVLHHVRRRYPSFIAHTGSCAKPNSSRRLRFNLYCGSLQVVANPCWKMALPDIISAILAQAPGPLPRSVLSVRLLASSRKTTASHPTSHVRHTENSPAMQLQQE
jgi:hypothetical protein